MVIVSLTTTPPKMFGLSSTIDSLFSNQKVKPDLIVVNVCHSYSRFNSKNLSLSLKSNSEKVIVNPCVDSGPATKILGLLESSAVDISDDDVVVMIDDDYLYPSSMIEEYLDAFSLIKNENETVLGIVGVPDFSLHDNTESSNINLKRVGILKGWGSYCMKGVALKRLNEIYTIHHFPNSVFYHEDLFISNIMNKYFDLRVVQTERLALNKTKKESKELEKHLKSMSLYIRKGLLNIDIDERTKKEIVFRDFILRNGSRLEFEDLEGMSLRDSIEHLDELDKHCAALNLMYELMRIRERDDDKYIDAIVALIERFGVSKGLNKFLERLPFSVRQKRNMKAAVIFHFPIDGRHGCHTRAMESIRALVSLGMEVHLITKNQPKEEGMHNWTNEAAESMKQAGVMVLDIFDGEEDYEWPSISWSNYVKEKLSEVDYDFILVNYEDVLTEDAYKLISKYPSAIDTHDNIKLNNTLQSSIDNLDSVDECRRFYHRHRNLSRKRKHSIPRIYISDFEYENSRLKGDAFIPHISQPSINTKSFLGNPIFIGSDNVFNKIGVDFLDSLIDFPVDIFGLVSGYAKDKGNENFNCKGYQEDSSTIFGTACFSMCPLILGTGAKIKIQESLANATPVVAMIDSGLNSDIIHGVNGFLCYTEEEFKKYCGILNQDRELCSEMGKAAAGISEKKSSQCLNFKEYFEILIRAKTARKSSKNAR